MNAPGDGLADGQTYAWDAQAAGSGGTSAFSSPCYFTVDDSAPANAPTVTASNCPSGQSNQGGAPIQLTFGANGDSDVAGYEFSWSGTLPVAGGATIGPYGVPQPIDAYSDPQYFVQASALGGSATVSLIPPAGHWIPDPHGGQSGAGVQPIARRTKLAPNACRFLVDGAHRAW